MNAEQIFSNEGPPSKTAFCLLMGYGVKALIPKWQIKQADIQHLLAHGTPRD